MDRYWKRVSTFLSFIVISLLVALIAIPTHAQDPGTHVVQRGENLFRIALNYGVPMEELIAANNIEDPRRIFSGQELVIPGLSNTTSAPNVAAAATVDVPDTPLPETEAEVVNSLVASTPSIHIVQPGETLGGIAKQYGISQELLIQANNITNPNRILRGQTLQVWTVENSADDAVVIPETTLVETEVIEQPAPTTNTIHIVQKGEHLAQIALQYGVSWPVIAQMNNISDPNHVYAGQELIVPALNAAGGVNDLGILVPPAPAPDAGPTITTGKQIVVDLSDSRIYAYDNGELVRNVLVSTGLPGTPTVQGDYSVYVKHEAQTMAGPGYYLTGVPWVMYFYKGYGIHGTYWHSNFGQPMSHGCVNLPTPEAKWFYDFAVVGTPVHVRY